MREIDLHRSVAAFLRVALMDSECLHFHCPNGERRDARTGSKLKSMGARAGVPDFCFVLPGGYAGFIELKGDGGLSPSQRSFSDDCQAIGAKWAMCRSIEQVVDILTAWGVPLHAKL